MTPAPAHRSARTSTGLEGYAARLASQRITDAQVEELARLRGSAAADSQPTERVESNEIFHNQLIAIAGNERLASMLARDGDAAERIAREHIQSALEIIIARLP